MACIIYKNFIINRSLDAIYENFWINLDSEFKHNMREAILATLASQNNLVRMSVANLISAIASIEIPRNEWDGLLPSLTLNAENQDLNIRLTSLTTLGFICEELQPEHVND